MSLTAALAARSKKRSSFLLSLATREAAAAWREQRTYARASCCFHAVCVCPLCDTPQLHFGPTLHTVV
jgi:hypothetical protein